jgi:hypothetical protein
MNYQSTDKAIVFLYGLTSDRIITGADGRTRRRAAKRRLSAEGASKAKKPRGFAK